VPYRGTSLIRKPPPRTTIGPLPYGERHFSKLLVSRTISRDLEISRVSNLASRGRISTSRVSKNSSRRNTKHFRTRAPFGNLIFGLGAGPPPKFWPARQQLLSCQQFFIKSRARSRSRFIKIGHTVSAQIKVEGRKRVCRSLTFATSTGIYHTIGAFKECSFLLIDGQFSLSQDVTKFMWRSSANKIREIRFPKPTLDFGKPVVKISVFS
jgi:hypothetical protein